MTKEKKLSKIYEVIADRTLSFGCRVVIQKEYEPVKSLVGKTIVVTSDGNQEREAMSYEFEDSNISFRAQQFYEVDGKSIRRKTTGCRFCDILPSRYDGHEDIQDEFLHIIGHPVMIGDVLDWVRDTLEGTYEPSESALALVNKIADIEDKILIVYKLKRLPIDDQTDECIDFIYSLVKDYTQRII